MEKMKSEKRLIIGIILLLLGGLLLANNFNLIPWEIKYYIWRWEMILVGLGLIHIVSKKHKASGIVLIAVGAFFMLPDLFEIPFSFKQLFWPAILILIGVLIILKGKETPRHSHQWRSSVDDQEYFDDLAVFGGGDKVITSQNLKGGKITCVFGGSNINLNRANLATGKQVIDIFALFGGSKIIVPEDWYIKIDVVSIFGGFEDKRVTSSNIHTDTDKQLIIKGLVIFGGGELKNF